MKQVDENTIEFEATKGNRHVSLRTAYLEPGMAIMIPYRDKTRDQEEEEELELHPNDF